MLVRPEPVSLFFSFFFWKNMPPQNWRTPKVIYDALKLELSTRFPGQKDFAYDLCADMENNLAPHLPGCFTGDPTFPYDCTLQPWNFKEVAFCNPPWNNVYRFTDRAIEYKTKVCFLLPGGRVDQTWFYELSQHAYIEFFKGRVAYEDPLDMGRTQPREGSIVAWTGVHPGFSRRFRNAHTGEYINYSYQARDAFDRGE